MQGTFFFGTNWKMHMANTHAREYISELLPLLKQLNASDYYLFVIPSFISLQLVRDAVGTADVDLKVGAQNVHWEEGDESTGEISIRQLTDIPVDLVEVGHSERRQKFGETDATIHRKVRCILDNELTALICIGENRPEKEGGVGKDVLEKQTRAALEGVSEEQLDNVMLAYEPAWAIGVSGQPAEPAYVGEQHSFIRGALSKLFGSETAGKVPLLYGGSVNHENFASYATLENVNGLFVGRSAWTPPSFVRMVNGIRKLSLGVTGAENAPLTAQ